MCLLPSFAKLPGLGIFPGMWIPCKQHLCVHITCVNSWRCSPREMQPSFSWLLPCPGAGGAGVDWINPCAASSAVSWARSSSSSVFGVVVVTQIIWELSWQPEFTHTAAPGPAGLICASLCTPQACHCILGNVSCLAARGSDWNCAKPSKERGGNPNHLFLWLGKKTLRKSQVLPAPTGQCSVPAQSLCGCHWALELWPDPVYEGTSGLLPASAGALLTLHKESLTRCNVGSNLGLPNPSSPLGICIFSQLCKVKLLQWEDWGLD